jgi:hypothetical protein
MTLEPNMFIVRLDHGSTLGLELCRFCSKRILALYLRIVVFFKVRSWILNWFILFVMTSYNLFFRFSIRALDFLFLDRTSRSHKQKGSFFRIRIIWPCLGRYNLNFEVIVKMKRDLAKSRLNYYFKIFFPSGAI